MLSRIRSWLRRRGQAERAYTLAAQVCVEQVGRSARAERDVAQARSGLASMASLVTLAVEAGERGQWETALGYLKVAKRLAFESRTPRDGARWTDEEMAWELAQGGWPGMRADEVIPVLVQRGIRPTQTSGNVSFWLDRAGAIWAAAAGGAPAPEPDCSDIPERGPDWFKRARVVRPGDKGGR